MRLRLTSPLERFYVNQPFGANPKLYAQFGIKGHNGLDLNADTGTKVYASHDGNAYYQRDNDGGEGIIIVSNEMYDFDDGTHALAKTIYWHLVSIHDPRYKWVVPTDGSAFPVKQGDLIAYSNNTGFSTGAHLHFGLKPVMPGETPDVTYNYAQNNGYAGAIDPTPYLVKPEKKASDYVYEAAAQKAKEGNMVASNVFQALGDLLRLFGQ